MPFDENKDSQDAHRQLSPFVVSAVLVFVFNAVFYFGLGHGVIF